MEFFDRKQEVVDIKLTQYGKNRLAKGKFKPTYYAFFDNDIIYDTNHGENGYEEVQKESEDRIKSALRQKTQTVTYGLETQITKLIDSYQSREDHGFIANATDLILQKLAEPPPEKLNLYTLTNPLGSSELNSFYTPYWDLNSMVGKVKSSSPYLESTDTDGDVERIPQVNIDIFYDTFISTGNIAGVDEIDNLETVDENGNIITSLVDEYEPDYEDTSDFAPKTYADGTRVKIKRGFSLIDLVEGHTNDNIENFDICVYRVVGKTLFPLKFRDNEYLYLNSTQIFSPELNNNIKIDSSYVEYFFELKVDEEIEDVVRSAIPDAKLDLPENNFEEPCED
tara:strand:- start:4227 stop:5243 length:1017 start_codon:yes stop_codon:yes gene_type:complete